VHELISLLLCVGVHEQVLSFTVRSSFSFLFKDRRDVMQEALRHNRKAVDGAHSNVQQQLRLLVEQCKLFKANPELKAGILWLDHALLFQYPEEPLKFLHELRIRYALAPGPPLTRNDLKLYEMRSADDWQQEATIAEAHATELGQQLQLHLDQGANTLVAMMSIKQKQQQAEQARFQADLLAAHPHSFNAAMNKSLTFFHPDKRPGVDHAGVEFGQVNEAWNQLCACHKYFLQLRTFRAQVAAAAQNSAQQEVQACSLSPV